MPKICIIFNPAASGEKARRFRERLGALPSFCSFKPTLQPGEGRKLAAEAVRQGYDTIIAAGGDGTVNEVLNGIGDKPGGLEQVCFGVLPLGTVNVFARELKLPLNFEGAWEIVQKGNEIRVDLPLAEFSSEGHLQRRSFVQLAGAGFDAQANAIVSWDLKKKFGVLAYFIAGFKAMRGPLPQIAVNSESETQAGQMVLVGNGRLYGGGFPLFPRAELQDGLLEVTVFRQVNIGAVVRAVCGLACNRLYTLGGARNLKAATLTISGADTVPFQLDGENAGFLPVKFTMRRHALRVLAPK